MGLALVAVFLYSGTMSTSGIVSAQDSLWYGVILAPSFAIYVIAMVGETNRTPFDLPEAEGELVGGFHTEYSSMKFALFFLAEYINMMTVSAVAATLFLGGWRAPWPLSAINGGMFNTGYWPILWFLAKLMIFLFLFIWLRGTLPRLRYDQFMAFGWKRLIPISLVWIIGVAALKTIILTGWASRTHLLMTFGVVAVLLLLLAVFGGESKGDEEEPDIEPEPFDAFAGGYPVPPMPGQPVVTMPDIVAGDSSLSENGAGS